MATQTFFQKRAKINERSSLPGPFTAVTLTGVHPISEVVNHFQVITLNLAWDNK